jgi:hypothetical protein
VRGEATSSMNNQTDKTVVRDKKQISVNHECQSTIQVANPCRRTHEVACGIRHTLEGEFRSETECKRRRPADPDSVEHDFGQLQGAGWKGEIRAGRECDYMEVGAVSTPSPLEITDREG